MAADEFNGLSVMKKGQAVMATGINLKLTSKIPDFVKAAIEGIKKDLLEL
jgi:hypothetical protein